MGLTSGVLIDQGFVGNLVSARSRHAPSAVQHGGPDAIAPAPRGPVEQPATTPSPVPTTAGCLPTPASFDCDFRRRIATAQAYLRTRPGVTAIVLRDRRTGAVWRNEYADRPIWTASTIKLAMAVDLLLRERAGFITLSTKDQSLIETMLRDSNDLAANRLWQKYGADTMATRFPEYGVRDATFGNSRRWGSMRCTADDLDRLMTYVLERLPAAIRARVIAALRGVSTNQQWGVWAAGPAARPGNKNGWFGYSTGWVMNSVGFAGPAEQYTLTLMNDLRGEGGYDDGQRTISRVAALIFKGRW